MRVLIVQRHYWPVRGAPSEIARDIAERLALRGHDVSVVSSMPVDRLRFSGPVPPRRETVGGVSIKRLRIPEGSTGSLIRRLTDALGFAARVFVHLLTKGGSYDVVVVSTLPPVLLATAVRWACRVRSCRYVYHCQDLNPEAALIGGVMQPGRWTAILAALDRANCSQAASVVVLSDDMVETIRQRGVDLSNVHVINNFLTFDGDVGRVPSELRKPRGTFQVVFAGNLGLVQGLENLIDAAHLLPADGRIRLLLVGNGHAKAELEERAGSLIGDTITFVPGQPLATALAVMEESDLGVVSLSSGIARVAYPSKTMAYLAVGCPVLAVVDEDTDLARMVTEREIGAVVSPDSPRALADAILGESERTRDRDHVRRVGEEMFGRNEQLAKWMQLFDGLETR